MSLDGSLKLEGCSPSVHPSQGPRCSTKAAIWAQRRRWRGCPAGVAPQALLSAYLGPQFVKETGSGQSHAFLWTSKGPPPPSLHFTVCRAVGEAVPASNLPPPAHKTSAGNRRRCGRELSRRPLNEAPDTPTGRELEGGPSAGCAVCKSRAPTDALGISQETLLGSASPPS